MKTLNSKILLIILVMIFTSCSKVIIENNDPEPTENKPPQKPQIEILKLRHNSATISCGKAFDPDQDKLYYSLYLEDSLIISNSNIDFLYKFENLKAQTNYNGVIRVTDSINACVDAEYTFTTSEYVTRFSNTYTSMLGNVGTGMSIDYTDDGGYIILGTISTGEANLYTLKIDSLGFEQWSRLYDIHCWIDIGEIIKVSNGNYVFVTCEHVIMIDSNGEIIWHHTKEGYANYKSIIENDNNELIIAGESPVRAFSSKFNLQGEKIWEKYYHGENERFVNSLCKTHDDNYMILGVHRVEDDNDFWIIKIDQNGEVLWEKDYEDPDYAHAEQIILCKDNGFAIAGQTYGNMNISTTRILKCDVNGNLMWDKAYRWNNSQTDVRSIVQNMDESFIFCAKIGHSPQKAVLAKLDQAGDLLWKHNFKPEEGTLDYIWRPIDMKSCPDNGVIVTGYKGWVWNGYGNQEKGLWVFKTDEDGYYSID